MDEVRFWKDDENNDEEEEEKESFYCVFKIGQAQSAEREIFLYAICKCAKSEQEWYSTS